MLIGFLLMNLLVLLEVADRLSLKRDLEVAREIQQAMLPEGLWSGPERTLALYPGTYTDATAANVGQSIFDAVERHRRDSRLADDLSVLVLSRLRKPVALPPPTGV